MNHGFNEVTKEKVEMYSSNEAYELKEEVDYTGHCLFNDALEIWTGRVESTGVPDTSTTPPTIPTIIPGNSIVSARIMLPVEFVGKYSDADAVTRCVTFSLTSSSPVVTVGAANYNMGTAVVKVGPYYYLYLLVKNNTANDITFPDFDIIMVAKPEQPIPE